MKSTFELVTTDCTEYTDSADAQSSSSVTPWMKRVGQSRSEASLHPCNPCHPWFSLPALVVNTVDPGLRAQFESNWTFDKLPRRFASPGGRIENSPAFQRWVRCPNVLRPEGTAESNECPASAPTPILWQQLSRPFGTRFHTPTFPPLKGWAILESPSGRWEASAQNVQIPPHRRAMPEGSRGSLRQHRTPLSVGQDLHLHGAEPSVGAVLRPLWGRDRVGLAPGVSVRFALLNPRLPSGSPPGCGSVKRPQASGRLNPCAPCGPGLARIERTDDSFPLTPALSLGEREPCIPSVDNPERSGKSCRLRTILPLPRGEGRGEGERVVPNIGICSSDGALLGAAETVRRAPVTAKPSRLPSPGGRIENSPAFQRWVRWPNVARPEGTAESNEIPASAPTPILWQQLSRPFGTRFHTPTIPPLKGWAILNSPFGRKSTHNCHAPEHRGTMPVCWSGSLKAEMRGPRGKFL